MSRDIFNSWSYDKRLQFAQDSFYHTSPELVKMYNLSLTTVKRIRKRFNLRTSSNVLKKIHAKNAKRMIEVISEPERFAQIVTKRNETKRKLYADERRRVRHCLPQKTKYSILPYADSHVKRSKLYNARSYLFSKGYISTDDIHVILYDDQTRQVAEKKRQQYLDNYRIRLIHISDYDPDEKKILAIHDHLIAGERNIAY